jgi:hypothetical protein
VLRLVPPTEHQRVRWKNGGGWTTELARAPAEGEFDWRISIAEVDVDGGFSRFEGIDRSLLVLAGEGMVLELAGVAHTLRGGDPALAFAGELDVFARLLGGPTRDFNVMTRRGAFEHALARVELAGTHALAPVRASSSWFVYVEAGRAELGPHALVQGHAALLDEPLALRGDATLVVATLRPAGA